MNRLFLISVASLLCGATAHAAIDVGGTAKRVDTLECRTVGPGVQYVRMHMPEYPLDVYTLTIDLNNPYNDVNAFIGKDHAGSTEAMTEAYTRLSTPGHRSIGSINGNFWIVSGQGMDSRLLGQPHSGCMVNGEIATEPNDWNRGRGDTDTEKLQDIGFVVLDEEKKMWIDDMYFGAQVTNSANESFAIAEVNRILKEGGKFGVFNDAVMNDAVYKFRRYEDASLSYTGIDKHEGERIGLWDTTVDADDLSAR